MVVLAAGISGWLVPVAMIVIIVTLLRRLRRKTSGRTGQSRSARNPLTAASTFAAPRQPLPEDLARWEVQVHETAREAIARIDSKLHLLEHWVRHAEATAARLEQAVARAEGPTNHPAPPSCPNRPHSCSPPAKSAPKGH